MDFRFSMFRLLETPVSEKIPTFFRKFTNELVHRSPFQRERVVNNLIYANRHRPVFIDESRLLTVFVSVTIR